MTAIQKEVIDSLEGLSEEKLTVVLRFIGRRKKESSDNEVNKQKTHTKKSQRIGVLSGMQLLSDDCDFDADNAEIAALFDETP